MQLGRIYIFGASCSGKSSLAQALHKKLGNEWTYLDRDLFIETGTCTDDTANAFLDLKIGEIKSRVIVDAQIPWKIKEKGDLYLLMHPPLNVLLERDSVRTANLQRSESRALYAKQYVINTHKQLDQQPKEEFDACFDSSTTSIEELIHKVVQLLFQQAALQK